MSLPDIPVMGWALVVGVLVGMTGIGLGPIGTPGLLLFFPDITRTVAVASNIISGGIAKISGTAIYQKNGLIVPSIAIAYIVCGFPTLILGSLMLDVVGKQPFFSPLVGGILLLAALSLAVRYLVIRAPARTLEVTRTKIVMAGILGAAIGFVVGLTSIGTGSLTIAGFLILLKLPAHYVVGTTLLTAPVFLLISGVTHVVAGNVSWALTGNLLIGQVVGIAVGSYFAPKIPRLGLRLGITALLAVAAIILIVSGPGK